jgi:hypothetical protein
MKKNYIYISPHARKRLEERLKFNNNKLVWSVYQAYESKETSEFLENKIKENNESGFQTYTFRQFNNIVYIFQQKKDLVLITAYEIL